MGTLGQKGSGYPEKGYPKKMEVSWGASGNQGVDLAAEGTGNAFHGLGFYLSGFCAKK
jgi:hypothetical protein